MEDMIGLTHEGTVSDSSVVADTDAESASEDGSSSSSHISSDVDALPVVEATLCLACGGGARKAVSSAGRMHKTPLCDNGYFYSADNGGEPDVKICMHSYSSHEPPAGMGAAGRSKTLTPAHYGESKDNSVRSFLLLRAWMLWRVRHRGWATSERGRAREFAEEATYLKNKIAALNPRPRGMLLGTDKADTMLICWVPDIVELLVPT